MLVVDDNPDIAQGCRRLLHQAGHDTAAAGTGAEALAAVEATRPHLVLLDRNLPDMDGLEVCRRIKGDPITANTVVIMASAARVRHDDQISGFETGADGTITRPIENHELLLRLEPFARIIRLNLRLEEELGRRRLLEADLEARVERRTRDLTTANRQLDQSRQAALRLIAQADVARQSLAVSNAELHVQVLERQRAEERWREGEEKLRAIAASIPGAIFQGVRDADGTLRFPFMSEGARGMFEMPEDDIQNKDTLFSLVHPDDHSGLLASIDISAAALAVWTWEFRIVTRAGTQKWLRGVAAPRSIAQGAVCWNGVLLDITGRKQAEVAMRASEAKWRSYITAAPVGVLVCNAEGRHLEANRCAEEMLGYDSGELLRTRVRDLPAPEDAGPAARHFAEVAERGLSDGQFRLLRKGGGRIWVSVRAAKIGEDRFLAVLQDITRRRHAEESLRATEASLREAVAEAKSQRDDLRRLQAQLAQVQEEERRTLAAELHDQVGQGLIGLGLQLNVIHAEFQRVAPGSPVPAIESARALLETMATQIRTVMAGLRPPVLDDYGAPAALRWLCDQLAGPSGLTLSVDAVPEQVRLPAATELALFRIAQEALTNVIKHARAARASVGFEVVEGRVTLEITDNGVGFDPADRSTLSKNGGLGLALMAERAAALRGTFTLDAAPGRGTTVRVEVPA